MSEVFKRLTTRRRNHLQGMFDLDIIKKDGKNKYSKFRAIAQNGEIVSFSSRMSVFVKSRQVILIDQAWKGKIDQTTLAWHRTLEWIAYYEGVRSLDHGFVHPTSLSALTNISLHFFAAGWPDKAEWVMKSGWKNYGKIVKPELSTLDQYFAWFGAYFTLRSRDLIEPTGITEPDDPNSPYALLLECWDDPDPNRVKNSLIAYSELNMARSMLPKSKTAGDYDDRLWWYYPWDIIAINMRRKSMGLKWIDNGDLRTNDAQSHWSELPFAKDNIIWPLYLKFCQNAGFEPYEPDDFIEITVDPETLLVIGG